MLYLKTERGVLLPEGELHKIRQSGESRRKLVHTSETK